MALDEEKLDSLLGSADLDSLDTNEFDMSDMDELLKAVSDGIESTENADTVSLENDINEMSEDDILRILEENQSGSTNGTQGDSDLSDLSDLLGAVDDNDDLQDIDAMLTRSDNNEMVDEDVLALLQGVPDDAGEQRSSEDAFDVFAEDNSGKESRAEAKARKAEEKRARKAAKQESKAAQKAAKLEKKNKKNKKNKKGQPEEAVNAEGQEAATEEQAEFSMDVSMDMLDGAVEAVEKAEKQSKPKKGVFAKIVDFLTEEDLEETDEEKSMNLSEENATILKDMKKEDKKKGKGSKKKKKGKEAPEGEEGEEGEEQDDKGKKSKKKKKEKKPKEEVPVIEEVERVPEKKLPMKKVLLIAATAASFMAVLLVFASLVGDYADRQNASKAYYDGNYQAVYQDLYGKKLDENEQVMFNRSEYILRMNLNWREYEYLTEQGMAVEALDSLIQSVVEYPELYAYASQWNAAEDVQKVYNQMLSVLQNQYQLTEAQVLEIAAEPDDVEYTRIVTAVAGGKTLEQWKDEKDRAAMQHVLPEEEELLEAISSFVESGL